METETQEQPSTSDKADEIETPIEIESMCPGCKENGTTKIMSINIPFYRQVIVMSFACEHCGLRNNNLQSGEQAQVSTALNYRYLHLNILFFQGVRHRNCTKSEGKRRPEPDRCPLRIWNAGNSRT
jgi:zinc finger protein